MASKRQSMLGDRKAAIGNVYSTGAEQTIDNPFLAMDDSMPDPTTGRTGLQEYVHQFVQQNAFQDRDYLLEVAARLARDKDGALILYQEVFTEPEKVLINHEKDHATGFWRQAKFFKATSKQSVCRNGLTLSLCWTQS